MLLILVFSFFSGLCFGSFANVCIYRLQRDESIVFPGSHCPKCNAPIFWYHNIPILSFLFLRGACSSCKMPISWRYPSVELLTGFTFAITVRQFWPSPFTYFVLAFVFILIVISGIDFDTQLIPDILSYGLAVIGLAAAPSNYLLGTGIGHRMIFASIGALSGAGLLIAVAFIGEKIFKKEAMGGGDIKLMLGIGAFVGPGGLLQTIFLASLAGSVAGIWLIISGRMKRGQYLPFGPCLALGAFLTLLLPDLTKFVN